jgi:hypothetical protein
MDGHGNGPRFGFFVFSGEKAEAARRPLKRLWSEIDGKEGKSGLEISISE